MEDVAGFERVGELLDEFRARFPDYNRDPYEWELFGAPSVAAAEQAVILAEKEVAWASGVEAERRAQAGLRVALGKLDLARRRDEISASRPEGCWCLGFGGRERRYLPLWDGRGEPTPVWATYCDCPEGEAARAEDDAKRGEFWRAHLQARVERAWADNEIPAGYRGFTFESFPATEATRHAVDRVRSWASGEGDWLVLSGPFGVGKTGLAVAAFGETAYRGQAALFVRVPDLLARLKRSYDRVDKTADPSEWDLTGPLQDVETLFLDDLGAERGTEWAEGKLSDLLCHRHAWQRRTLFTTNLPPGKLVERLGERAGDRLREVAAIVRIDGPNLRRLGGER